jgi:hypothetical protein
MTPARNGTRGHGLRKRGLPSKPLSLPNITTPKEQQKVNTSNNNFHGANAITNISQTLNNLAFAATTDQEIIAQLTQSNTTITATNKLLTEQLKTAMDNNTILIKKLNTPRSTPAKPTQAGHNMP